MQEAQRTSPEWDAEAATRYSRQMLFPRIGERGQQRLGAAHVAVVGVGATGAAASGLLARGGVGRLTLIDRDFVEPSNLQRQILFDEDDARQALPKAEAARRHLGRINSAIVVESHVADLVPDNIEDLLAGAQLILDCTDNFETRYLLNDFSVREGVPWIYAGAVASVAVGMNILPKTEAVPSYEPTACLACIFPEPPAGSVETCDTAGVLGATVNLAASIQVGEALKYLTGQPHTMRRTLLSTDLWPTTNPARAAHSEVASGSPRSDCSVCGKRSFRALAGTGRPHITLCGRNSVQIHEHARSVDLNALAERLRPLGTVRTNGMLLRFEVPPHTLTVFPDGRALIQGTTDRTVARSLYSRYLGA